MFQSCTILGSLGLPPEKERARHVWPHLVNSQRGSASCLCKWELRIALAKSSSSLLLQFKHCCMSLASSQGGTRRVCIRRVLKNFQEKKKKPLKKRQPGTLRVQAEQNCYERRGMRGCYRNELQHNCATRGRNRRYTVASVSGGGPAFTAGQQGQKLRWKTQHECETGESEDELEPETQRDKLKSRGQKLTFIYLLLPGPSATWGSSEEAATLYHRAAPVCPRIQKPEEILQQLDTQLGTEWDASSREPFSGTKCYGVPNSLVIKINNILM